MAKNFTNQQIAHLLKSISAAYQIKGESLFKIMAYDRAATAIEHLTSEVKDYWDNNNLDSIPGIGASIAQHLDELFKTGKVKHFEEVLKGLPPAVFELIKISGIGPKTAFKLCRYLKIWDKKNAFKKIKQAAESQKIRHLPGFGEESEKKILEAIYKTEIKKKEKQRMLLPYANNQAEVIEKYAKINPLILEIKPLGSLRRHCATVGDIDFAVKTKKPETALNYLLEFPQIKKIINKGNKKATVLLKNEIQVDFRIQSPEQWGSLLQHLTGSKQHNIKLREFAQKKNLSLSEYGIKDLKKNKLIKTRTEKEFYRLLEMDWIPPELREDQGEIEAAYHHQLPKLVTLKEIKGDLHLHSNFDVEPSHDLGKNSIQEMIQKGKELGYCYLGFTEHNPSINQHTDKQIISILSRKKALIDQIILTCSKKLNIKILNGLEIDIKPDGQLAIPEKGFQYLDYAIVSIHTSFYGSQEKMTQRILRALEHPKVKILGHPTGRKLNVREGYEADWEKIFKFCKEHNKLMEINAWPDRQDLPDILVRLAIENKVPLVINTDAHSVEEMDLMKYGVYVARRGWATKENIINTYSFDKLIALLKIKDV